MAVKPWTGRLHFDSEPDTFARMRALFTRKDAHRPFVSWYRARGKAWALHVGGWSLQGLHTSGPVLFAERVGLRFFPVRLGPWRVGINRRAILKVR